MFGPLEHHEGVVDTDADDVIDTELFEIVVSGFVAWSVGGGAGWGEGARQAKDDDVFATEQFFGGDVLPAVGVWATDGFVADTGFKGDVWDALGFLEM